MAKTTTLKEASSESLPAKQDGKRFWDRVQQTDPAFTKSFNRGGGFKGTAINALYNIGRATDIFGPMGLGFGFDILSEQFLTGHPIRDKRTGDIIGSTMIHEIKIDFWFKDPETHERGHFPSSGATTFMQSVGQDTPRLVSDEEVVKKSITDAISKALSWLGFSADVFLGFYDDNKYVNDLKQRFENDNEESRQDHKPAVNGNGAANGKAPITDAARQAPLDRKDPLDLWVERVTERLKMATDVILLEDVWADAKTSSEWAAIKKDRRQQAKELIGLCTDLSNRFARQVSDDMGGLDSSK